jgi:hypothetical protein
MNDRALFELRDLGLRDAELAVAGAELRRRDLEVSNVRSRAKAIDLFFQTYSDEEAERKETLAAARA